MKILERVEQGYFENLNIELKNDYKIINPELRGRILASMSVCPMLFDDRCWGSKIVRVHLKLAGVLDQNWGFAYKIIFLTKYITKLYGINMRDNRFIRFAQIADMLEHHPAGRPLKMGIHPHEAPVNCPRLEAMIDAVQSGNAWFKHDFQKVVRNEAVTITNPAGEDLFEHAEVVLNDYGEIYREDEDWEEMDTIDIDVADINYHCVTYWDSEGNEHILSDQNVFMDEDEIMGAIEEIEEELEEAALTTEEEDEVVIDL